MACNDCSRFAGTRLLLVFLLSCCSHAQHVLKAVDIAPVWAGHPVVFSLLTCPPYQFVAYYDANRQLTVASRIVPNPAWTFTLLDEHVGWDSHNGIDMIADSEGYLHLAANMHASPLKYFRTSKPFDATTFARVSAMTGTNERRVTYPDFFAGPDGQMIFTYRDGSSGNGNQIYNRYNVANRTWLRLLDKPLTDGEGQCNAYFVGPVAGPDGYWHLCWVWRDTPDCATNHDVCYARTKDLIHWERSDGSPYTLPITTHSAEIVDPVPAHGGILNGCTQIGFDRERRVIISYYKFDPAGNTQIYNARSGDGKWSITQCTQWDYRWDFSGGGSITTDIHVFPVEARGDGTLTQSWWHKQYGTECWRLDPESLKPITKLPPNPSGIPPELRKAESAYPGMTVRFQRDAGRSGDFTTSYLLRWETLGANRDRPRDPPFPEPSLLRVYRIPN